MKRMIMMMATAAVALSGCVQHNWAPTGAARAPLGVASGQCKLVAMGAPSPGGFVSASGSQTFVAATVGASVLAGAIGSAVRQQNLYNACMEASGFVPNDAPPPAQPVAAQQQPAPVTATAGVVPSALTASPAASAQVPQTSVAVTPPQVLQPAGEVALQPCGEDRPCGGGSAYR